MQITFVFQTRQTNLHCSFDEFQSTKKLWAWSVKMIGPLLRATLYMCTIHQARIKFTMNFHLVYQFTWHETTIFLHQKYTIQHDIRNVHKIFGFAHLSDLFDIHCVLLFCCRLYLTSAATVFFCCCESNCDEQMHAKKAQTKNKYIELNFSLVFAHVIIVGKVFYK